MSCSNKLQPEKTNIVRLKRYRTDGPRKKDVAGRQVML